jgi:hypothetical protein
VLIVGGRITVKLVALIVVPLILEMLILLVVAVAGTVVVICESELIMNVATILLNFTDVTPVKFVPVIMTLEFRAPAVGLKLVMLGRILNGDVVVALTPDFAMVIVPVVVPAATVALI